MERLQFARNYFLYRLKATNAHGIHSPFVFELYNDVISDRTPYYAYDLVESLRARHFLDKTIMRLHDLGTGPSREEKISSIARRSVKPAKYAQLLFRLVNRFRSKKILEIGTSLGLTTLYLSMHDRSSSVVTLEGSPELAEQARKNFSKLKRNNITLIEGEFSATLPYALSLLGGVDFVYFDGNHTRQATLGYFSRCLEYASPESVFVFDDIHWSAEMENAWDDICAHPQVTTSIDLFQAGIVFFRKGLMKERFILRY